MHLGLAFRAFFAALFNDQKAEQLEAALTEPRPAPAALVAPAPVKPIVPVKPKGRSEALTLLAALQRESRLLDIVQEPLADYSDAQVGAAARDVLRNCGQVLQRFFSIRPASRQAEGSVIEVAADYDPQRYRLVGNVSGAPPFRGLLVHTGWVAERCEVPEWTGSADSALVLAPIEVEVGSRA